MLMEINVQMEIQIQQTNDPNDPCSYDPSSVTLAVTSMVDCDGDGVTDADEIAERNRSKRCM
ncbi:hypothetical protein, partial [Nonlabens tegetincola]|uniref:hypothetical protein n=1 Tax=Nonlabens tegetincola TaxID=323273 RepID=UPI000D4708A7